jgi:hypothetical protein
MLRTMTVASGLIIADTVRDLRDRSSAATALVGYFGRVALITIVASSVVAP